MSTSPLFEITRPGALSVSMSSRHFRSLLTEGAPGVLLFLFEGEIPTETFAHLEREMDACIALRGKVSLVGYGADWQSYGPGYRELWTEWFRKHRPQVASVHLLVRSLFLKMGVQVVNMLTRGIISAYSEPGEFERDVRRAFPGVDLSSLFR